MPMEPEPEPAATSGGATPPDGIDHRALRRLDDFHQLRRSFRRFVFPMTIAFLTWYLLYVVLSAYAREFMGAQLFGNVNVALVFGLLQFASTFGIAVAYERYARRRLDPLAERLRAASTASPTAPTTPAATADGEGA